MKTKTNINFLISLLLTFVIFNGCSPKMYVTKYQKVPYVSPADETASSQTHGGITVDLRPLKVEDIQSPVYKKSFNVKYKPTISFGMVLDSRGLATKSIEMNIPFFQGYVPFYATINNSTNHILRMRDARVIFVDPSSDEPFKGLTSQELLSVINELPVYKALVASLQKNYYLTDIADINLQVFNALAEIIKQMKIINNVDKEIIPEMKASGVLIFPVSAEKLTEGKISFVDMVSNTDLAGNPTEKVRFDFKTKVTYAYWKENPNNPSSWISISADEYNKGLSNPEKYTYDKKKWVLSTSSSKK